MSRRTESGPSDDIFPPHLYAGESVNYESSDTDYEKAAAGDDSHGKKVSIDLTDVLRRVSMCSYTCSKSKVENVQLKMWEEMMAGLRRASVTEAVLGLY